MGNSVAEAVWNFLENAKGKSDEPKTEPKELAKSDQPEKTEEPNDKPTTKAIEDKPTSSIEETTQSVEKGKKRKSDVKESGEKKKKKIDAEVTEDLIDVEKKKKAKNVSSDNSNDSINTQSEKDAESEKNVAESVPKETNSSKVKSDD